VGMIVGVPWHIDADPKSDFSQQSRKLWGADVNWRTALAYDAVRSLIAALQFNPTRTGIQQTLSSSNFSTTAASGIVRFLPSGAVFPPFITAGIRSSSAAWFQSRTNCRCD
ncbi:ABC transporter substrate-binding protein, partial [Planktothrix sp. FACHB-1355]